MEQLFKLTGNQQLPFYCLESFFDLEVRVPVSIVLRKGLILRVVFHFLLDEGFHLILEQIGDIGLLDLFKKIMLITKQLPTQL